MATSSGFEVDYGKALCAKMKVTCTFQNQDWDGVIPALIVEQVRRDLLQHEHHGGA